MKCLLIIVLFSGAKCAENIYMKHSEIEDQQTSASGYAYQLHSGVPLTATNRGGLVNHLAYPPLWRYPQELPLQMPLAVEYKPQTQQQLGGGGGGGVLPLNPYGVHPYALHYQQYPYGGLVFSPVAAPAPLPAVSLSDSSNFVKGGGQSFSDANENAHGEKGSTGYKTVQEYDKGAQGVHDSQGHKEFYNSQGGSKAAHNDEGGHYGQKQEAAKGSQGSHFSQNSSHKKGSKTSGFHRIHHKDEFKKDHSFYDESDSSGHFSKHGDYDSKRAEEKGAFEKGGHEDKGYKVGEQGVKGFLDKGHFDGQDSGFKGEEGKQAFYNNFQEFGKKGGQQQEKEQGFFKKDILQAQQ